MIIACLIQIRRDAKIYILMSDEFRLTTEEKLAIIEQLLEELSHGRTALQVIESDDALQGKVPPSAPVYTYSLLGSEQTRRTQISNLIMKVDDANKQRAPVEASHDDPQVAQKQRELFRYFKSNIRCFRCKKIGHHNYACLNDNFCFYCLSSTHGSDRCPQRTVCYQCYQWGHIISECSSPAGGFCQECKRKHSRVCCFLTKGIEPIKQMYNTDYLYNNENTRCMRCFEYGHLHCFPMASKHGEGS